MIDENGSGQNGERSELGKLLSSLEQRYGLDFAGNIDKIYHGETLHRTAEYMRKKYFSA